MKTGEDARDLVLRDSHELYSRLHSVSPALELIPQANGSVFGPISSPDKWPPSTAILFQYMTIRQMWTLDYNEPRKPKAGEELRPDYIYGNIILQGPCDIEQLIDAFKLDLRATGINASWKKIQERRTTPVYNAFGVPRDFCLYGMKDQLIQELKKDEDYMIEKEGTQSLDFSGVDFPPFTLYYNKTKDVPQRVGNDKKEFTLNNIKGYSQMGLSMLKFEMSNEAAMRLVLVIDDMECARRLKKVFGRKAQGTKIKPGNKGGGKISTQKNLRAQIHYMNELTYFSIPDMVLIEKEVEVRTSNGSPSPFKSSSLRKEMYELTHPDTGLVIFEAMIPRLSGPNRGTLDVSVQTNVSKAVLNRHRAVIKNMARAPAPWWRGYFSTVRKYSDNMIASIMDSFGIGVRLTAHLAEFDPIASTATSEFAAPLTFAEFMAKDMQLGGIDDSEIGSGEVDISLDERAMLHKNLGEKDDLSLTSQDQVSCAIGFVNSVGNPTNRTENTKQFQSNHKKRAVQNIKLTNNLANANNATAVANEHMLLC